ncbi:uncharacterized protein PITG_08359 [Phytophthora infestans T30-4]|uniref:Uncharacterized protein n=1 Tax=Phytophthora infestans (strain T30-4) TaxID=403677 RepID=D0NAE8_PHYIT|nr:uncharacterized protein PITG_08359 [Phytophthora infestans T30-4]EEY54806.1 conserved hypothetical protein [Phytophthora infestans T30-4]|eukprot:XP_002903751.1 conserved hypothetical protein [Phytophthora infestans T30-4]
MADDENNADLDNTDSATGLAACLASEEDESREVARAPRPRGVRAVKSNARGIVLHVHESNSDSDYEPDKDGNSEYKDDDVADDLEAECLDRNSNPLSQQAAKSYTEDNIIRYRWRDSRLTEIHSKEACDLTASRGVLVIDFLSLDEKAITMEKIFALFKSNNPRWEEIKSNSESTFDECYEAFRDYCDKIAPDVVAYFDKYWKSCTEMWASFARDRYFSAGNSTTNRIEANWHQNTPLIP